MACWKVRQQFDYKCEWYKDYLSYIKCNKYIILLLEYMQYINYTFIQLSRPSARVIQIAFITIFLLTSQLDPVDY